MSFTINIDLRDGASPGTSTQSGIYVVELAATNSAGTGNAKLTLSIGPSPTGTFYSYAALEGTVGVTLSTYVGYSTPDSGTPTYVASGLPDGLQMSTTGYISGTPTAAGAYPVTFSVTNAGGTTSVVRTFLIHAAPTPPVITCAEVVIPAERAEAVREGNAFAISAPGVKTSPFRNGRLTLLVGSGRYAFTVHTR